MEVFISIAQRRLSAKLQAQPISRSTNSASAQGEIAQQSWAVLGSASIMAVAILSLFHY